MGATNEVDPHGAARFQAIEQAALNLGISVPEFEDRLNEPGDFYRDQREKFKNLVEEQIIFLRDDVD